MTDETFEILIADALADVRPLKVDTRVTLTKAAVPAETLLHKRRHAERAEVQAIDRLSGEFIEPVDPHAVLAYKRTGIQDGVYRSLRLGKYAVDAQLDLHNLTVEQARAAVHGFIEDCVKYNIRVALVAHGKGEGRMPQPALLKSCIAHWLPQLTEVQAFHSAQKQHGGAGATYVLIRKSSKKTLDKAER